MEIIVAFLLLFGIVTSVKTGDENQDAEPAVRENQALSVEAPPPAPDNGKLILPECLVTLREDIYRDLTLPYSSQGRTEKTGCQPGKGVSTDE